ncbi:hypothetical protein ACWFRT_29480 [Streptomyces anulatus]
MTETLTTPAAGSPLALLFDITTGARQAARIVQDEERDMAATAAADHVYTAYPNTLGRAVDHDAWTGFPALRGNGLQPSAAVYLDGGLWLHHTSPALGDFLDVLTLLVPCDCGHGYVPSLLEDEDDLLELLRELRSAGGRAVHSGDTGGTYCASAPTA